MKVNVYFKNLWLALTGNNPYQMELDRVKEEYEKTAGNFGSLNELYYSSLERLDESARLLKQADKSLEEAKKDQASLQALVENYRTRIAEKDTQIAEMDKSYRQQAESFKDRISAYSIQVAHLQGELAKVRKRVNTAKSRQAKKTTGKQEAQS